MNEILNNIKKARLKKFYKNLAIGLTLALFAVFIMTDEESDLLVAGLIFLIPGIVFVIFGLRNLVSAFNCGDCKLFYRLNKVGNMDKISKYFYDQVNKKLFEDEKIILTPELFIKKDNYEDTFLNSEILDVTHLIHKTNFVIDYVSITILYSDGKNYEIKYKRPLGISDMEKKAKNVLLVANILANNCENLRSKKR